MIDVPNQTFRHKNNIKGKRIVCTVCLVEGLDAYVPGIITMILYCGRVAPNFTESGDRLLTL